MLEAFSKIVRSVKKANRFIRREARLKGPSRLKFGLALETLESRRVLAGETGFGVSFGGTNWDYGASVGTDAAGYVYTAGRFFDKGDFDPGPGTTELTSNGNYDIYVAKFNRSGALIWARSFGGSGNESIQDIAVDAEGNIVMVGYFAGTVDFDPHATRRRELTAPHFSDVFVAKWNKNGNYLWAGAFTGEIDVTSVKLDQTGNIFVAGGHGSNPDVDPGAGVFLLNNGGHNADAYVVKLDANGQFLWANGGIGVRFGGTVVNDIELDSNGNVYAVGQFAGTVDFNPSGTPAVLTANGGSIDTFIYKLSSDGVFAWAKQFTGASSVIAKSIAIDGNNNLFVVGSFRGTADFDPGSGVNNLTAAGEATFVTKLSGNGVFRFAKKLGDDGTVAYDVALDANGNLYITGHFNGVEDFDPSVNVVNLEEFHSGEEGFLVQLDNGGRFRYARSHQTNAQKERSVHVSSTGLIYLAGTHSQNSLFDADPANPTLAASGLIDGHLVQYVPELFVRSKTGNGSDAFTVRRRGDMLELVDNTTGVVIATGKIGEIRRIRVIGSDSEQDTLIIDFQSGGFFTLPDGISFVGGTGNSGDTVRILGSTTSNAVHSPDANSPGSGTVLVTSGTDKNLISLAGLDQPVLVTSMASLTSVSPGGEDRLTLSRSRQGTTPASLLSGTTNANQLQALKFFDVAAFTINAAAGDTASSDDLVTLNSESLLARGMTQMLVATGLGNDTLRVLNTSFSLAVGNAPLRFNAGTGLDTLSVTADVAKLTLSDNQISSSSGGRMTLIGVSNAVLTGGARNNFFDARNFSGTLTMNGLDGNDRLFGGSADDLLIGGNGDDQLRGGDGEDTLHGENGNDQLLGESGNDRLFGGNDNDRIDGGIGDDVHVGGAGIDTFVYNGTDQSDRLRLIYKSATQLTLLRTAVGATVLLEKDVMQNDAVDNVMVLAKDGDDFITVDLSVAIDGIVNGGLGNDVCAAPGFWTKISC